MSGESQAAVPGRAQPASQSSFDGGLTEAPSIFVVVPAFNESSMIGATLQGLVGTGHSVVVVDDCSRDDTGLIARRYPVSVLKHPFNMGQGAALQTGTVFALQQGAGIVVHFDADGQHDPSDIDRVIRPLLEDQADLVLGSRFLRAADSDTVPRNKRWLLKSAIVVNGLLTGVWLSDAHNGFRALSRRAATEVVIRENGYTHASEILLQARQKGLRIAEVAVRVHYSEYAIAKGQPLSNAAGILMDLIIGRFVR